MMTVPRERMKGGNFKQLSLKNKREANFILCRGGDTNGVILTKLDLDTVRGSTSRPSATSETTLHPSGEKSLVSK